MKSYTSDCTETEFNQIIKMKKLLLFGMLLPLAGLLITFGQVQTGTIEYEEVMKIEIKLEGEMKAMMKDLPKERRSIKTLYFSKDASLYEKSKTAESRDMSGFSGGGRGRGMGMGMGIGMNAPNNKVFIDLEKKRIVEQREFMTRMFLIKREMPETAWKITGNQKMVLNYPCMEATSVDTAGIVTRAWFAPSIPVQSGPALFCNLPGLVLEVNINDGSRVFSAQSINLETPEKEILKQPKEGKKVTQEEFDEIVAEKLKEMGVEYGGGPGSGRGVHIIRMHQ